MPLTMFGRSRNFRRTGRTSTEVRPNISFLRRMTNNDHLQIYLNEMMQLYMYVSECWLLSWVAEWRLKRLQEINTQNITETLDSGHGTTSFLQVLGSLDFGSWNCIVYCLYPGPALANRRPCSNFPSNPPVSAPPLPSIAPFSIPINRKVSALKSARDSGER